MRNPDINKQFEARHLSNTSSYIRKVRAAYEDAITEVTIGIDRISFRGQVFKLSDYPGLQRRIDAAIDRLRPRVQTLVISGIQDAWNLSNEKNNIFVDRRMALKQGFSSRAKKVYYDPNQKALTSFINRKEKGLGLSERVWNSVKPYKIELEKGLAEGIAVGRSSREMATELKSYLNDPENLFRRVIDADGKLQLSKAAREYNPGQGVYRSSYKNAARLTRTETNMSYRTADFERWQTMPFVKGIQVQLSNAHPKYDICDPLAGQYPKDFKFVGWHAQCLCFATPVMMSDEEFEKVEDAILAGDPVPAPQSSVSDVPEGFKSYMAENAEKIAGWKNEPYFIRDNRKYV
jgi:hypothetical protein